MKLIKITFKSKATSDSWSHSDILGTMEFENGTKVTAEFSAATVYHAHFKFPNVEIKYGFDN